MSGTIRATKHGQPIVVNIASIAYVEPNGDGKSSNVYLTSRDMLVVHESLEVIEERMNNSTILISAGELAEIEALDAEQRAADKAAAFAEIEQLQQSEEELKREHAGKNRGRQVPPETKPDTPPETKQE